SSVVRNGPADLAGIQPGDTIVAVEGQSCTDFDELYIQVGGCLTGRDAVVKISRGGRPLTVRVTLGKWHNPEFGIASNRPDPVEGLRVDYVSIASSSSDRAWARGVVVREVQKDSTAARHDLTEMVDVISAVNGEPVANPNDFYRLAERARQSGEPIQLLVVRPGEPGGSRAIGAFGLKVEAARIVTLKPGVPDRPVVVVAELSRSRVSAPTKLREFVDVISAVDGTTVQTPEDFYRVAESAAGARRAIQLSLINPERTISLP
ncbi:MAG: PDZ domain-containing protein, partial [Gemmataceae bacterium]|nr:PDZ domain-containing protein [Gemmataceae bacterium]